MNNQEIDRLENEDAKAYWVRDSAEDIYNEVRASINTDWTRGEVLGYLRDKASELSDSDHDLELIADEAFGLLDMDGLVAASVNLPRPS